MSNHRIIIEPGTVERHYWRDLWNYRGLFYFLAWRDILVRYKQTVIGIAWSVVRPLLTMLVMAFIGWLFGSDVPEGTPRLILVCCATLPWTFFSTSFSDAANSLVANSNLLTKVYFPRLIVPASTVIVCLLDFFISFIILLILMAAYGYAPSIHMIFLPLVLLLAVITSMGAGLFIAALNVKYRDFRYIIPFIVQFGLYISPVAFSSEQFYNHASIPEWVKTLYSLNPMVGVIDGFRWCVLGDVAAIHVQGFVISAAFSIFLLFFGVYYFRKTEKSIADII